MFADFVGVSMDQIFNQMAKFRYMFGGKTTCPVVVRLAMGAGMNMGAQHSQTIYALLTAVPGLKVVVPSNAYDAKGLLIQAIRDDDPVMFFEHKALYPRKGEVPDDAYTMPFGEANVLREGDHVTVVAIGRMVVFAEKAIDSLLPRGITCDLIDPRTTSPLDEETILESVEHTGRLVVVDESNAALQRGERHRGADRPARALIPCAEAPDRAGDHAACAGAVLAGARARLRAERGEDRGRGHGRHGRLAVISALTMPAWGMENAGGTVIAWLVPEGTRIEARRRSSRSKPAS